MMVGPGEGSGLGGWGVGEGTGSGVGSGGSGDGTGGVGGSVPGSGIGRSGAGIGCPMVGLLKVVRSASDEHRVASPAVSHPSINTSPFIATEHLFFTGSRSGSGRHDPWRYSAVES